MLSNELIQTETQPPVRKMKDRNVTDQPTPAPRKTNWGKILAVCALCVLVVAGVVWGVKRRQAAANGAGAAARLGQTPVPVVAGTVVQKDVPVYLDGLGTVQAFNTVTVHVRVDGQLKKVAFVEGQDVKTGDVLAQIDPDPFQAALDQAKAKKGQDAAQLTNAEIDLKRETALYAAKIDSQQVFNTQQALVNQLDAAVKADEAAIQSAQVNLNYTTVTAPIDGRTGIRLVDAGNDLHATDTGGLVVLTQLKPISVIFTLPEQNLVEIHQEMAANGSEPTVLAVGRDNSTVLGEGTLAVIDNQIDTTTGTIRLKATFPNDQLLLWPGQFVNARLRLTTKKDALVVPASAIQRGPDGAFVFVITNGKSGRGGASGKGKPTDTNAPAAIDLSSKPAAKPKPDNAGEADGNQEILSVKIQAVTVAPQIEAGEAMIQSGLKKGDRIVTEGQYKLQDGSQVKIASAKNTSADSGPKDAIQ